MASSSNFASLLVILMVLWNDDVNGCYTSIISFGDSLADTGNLKQLAPMHPCVLPPYGQTFSDQPTGRCSNGRLIIDFLAESLGLPLIPPFTQKIRNTDTVVALEQGVNYAVGGATALNSSFLKELWPEKSVINASLEVQVGWFKQSLPSICGNNIDCKKLIGNSLILMGEIGGNDYNPPLLAGKPMDEVKSYVPLIIDIIISAVNELIELGARTLVVPGNLPIGCASTYLSTRAFLNEDHDPTTGCLIRLNEFVEFHNTQLQAKLNQIRELHPNVIIIYADYYNAAMQFYRSPKEFGFSNGGLKACCGGGGPFNCNLSARCGDASTTVCDEPDTYVSWDGRHLTEAAYKIIFKSLFQGPYTTPQFNSLCNSSASESVVGLWNSE